MSRYEIGMLAKSKAGHDLGHTYVIKDIDDAYVYLTDGSIRTIDRLKKKKKKHVQVICKKHDITASTDVVIKRILKDYKEEAENEEDM
ncbi:MAG: KOW domain-containing RNA-binding protein [Lachnospiraceae bacterium]